MKNKQTLGCCCGLLAALAMAGCAATYDGPRSGFLTDHDYDMLKKDTSAEGAGRHAYLSADFQPGKYD
jgi:hypothetical protein